MLYFSIVMPVYNKEKYVKASIKSILAQTYPYFELIVVDDGSADDSGNIVKSIDDKRIRYIYQKNAGESVARNHGISIAKNEFITFLDSDDLWLPDYLETMNNLIVQYPDKKVFGCSYLHEYVTSNTMEKAIAIPKRETVHLSDNYFLFTLSHPQSLTSSSTAVHKSVFDVAGLFPVGVTNWVDLDLWARIGMHYDIIFTERICSIYNDLPDSVSKEKKKPHAPTFDNYKKFMRRADISSPRKKYFREYVINLKMQSAYKQYILDGKGFPAMLEILPFFNTKMHAKKYISLMLQFMIGTETFYTFLSLLKRKRHVKTTNY